jgi:rhomboid family GlyGly-CTERM serine protease
MDAPSATFLKRRVPTLTLWMLVSAVVVAVVPRWSSWLIYDRSAILSGQIWRMFTCHWVHFSARHLFWDVMPLGIAGWILETGGRPRFDWFCLLTPWVISAALVVFEPRMRFCGGLSGVATAAIALLALDGLSDAAPWRWICLTMLLGLAGKIFFELTTGHGLFVTFNQVPVVISTASHIAGAAAALVFYALSKPASRLICRRLEPWPD